ncbi:uncharacterized protein ARMOST_02176 [Armillaria ostoyae]|uniref:Uncharacterized protein n=1 Tax=Armillaria ostoyae TaxID=47428 RepID=A0A284QR07_ARMOS|nr:uncharacterized protein ARMOST_02176 [Armillaria ostoyae]
MAMVEAWLFSRFHNLLRDFIFAAVLKDMPGVTKKRVHALCLPNASSLPSAIRLSIFIIQDGSAGAIVSRPVKTSASHQLSFSRAATEAFGSLYLLFFPGVPSDSLFVPIK